MSEYDRLKKMKDDIVAKQAAESQHEAAMVIMQLEGANTRLAADLAALRAERDELKRLLNRAADLNDETWPRCWATDGDLGQRIAAALKDTEEEPNV